jgi:LmbE family N-acetylglucosaminyl deacetylase
MIMGLPECKKALILAPHPDDEALGCAGTIALLNESGVSSTVVLLTDGESLNGAPSPEIGVVRRQEGIRCSEILGCGEPIFIGLPDGEMEAHIEEAVNRLSPIIGQMRPDLIFSPSPLDYHRDHLATAKIAVKLMREAGTFQMAFYEVYSTIRFTHLVNITEAAGKKRDAILSYRTSLYERPEHYVRALLGLNAHRSIFVEGEGYYEALHVVDKNTDPDEVYNSLCYKDPDAK